jgi:hypothetical protein
MTNPKATSQTRTVEILKPGTFTDVNGRTVSFSAADVAELVDSYDAAVDQAPAVVGHPKTDDPAYAWAQSLSLEGECAVAEIGEIDAAFAEMVSAGRFKRISPAIYPREHPANPTPGKYYLKHIGFLGAAKPAIKGLAPVAFSQAQQADCITAEFDLPPLNFNEPLEDEDMPKPKEEQATIDLAAREQEIADREAALNARETEVANREAAVEQADKDSVAAASLSFAEGLVDKMILPPAQKERAAYLLTTLALMPSEALAFGEGEAAERPDAALRALLGEAKPVLSFGELAKPDEVKTTVLGFASPDGHAIDPAALEVHNKAVTLQQENSGLSYLDAVKRASMG